jgi:hypothetical protein
MMSKVDKIIIDLKALERINLSFEHYVSLVQLYIFKRVPYNIEELIKQEYVIKIGNKYIIAAHIRRLIYDNLIREGTELKDIPEEVVARETIVDRIDEYRSKWKEATHGRKPGIMGTKRACLDKMTQWMKENPEYTFDQILKAADLYLESVDNIKYVQRADYFISKKENGIISSRLSAFIEEVEDDTPLGNWTNELL